MTWKMVYKKPVSELKFRVWASNAVASALIGALVCRLLFIPVYEWFQQLPWGHSSAPAWVQAVRSVVAILIAIAIPSWQASQQRRSARQASYFDEVNKWKTVILVAVRVKDLSVEYLQWTRGTPNTGWKGHQHYIHSVEFLLAALEQVFKEDSDYDRWFGCMQMHESLRNFRSMLSALPEGNQLLKDQAGLLENEAEGYQDAWGEDLLEWQSRHPSQAEKQAA